MMYPARLVPAIRILERILREPRAVVTWLQAIVRQVTAIQPTKAEATIIIQAPAAGVLVQRQVLTIR